MEDVLLLTAGLLAEDERVAAQVRRQYKWFVVDEFQDVSPLQSALLDLWLGGRDELCVVGDPAQTIYSFAGANADYLRDFPAKHPGTTSIELVRNYRSTPQVVEAANRLLAGTPSQGVALRAQQPAGRGGRVPRAVRRGGRGRRGGRPDRGAAAVRAGAGRDRGAVPDQRPVGELRGGAGRPRHPLRHPRRGPVLRPARGARGGDPDPRRGPVRRGRTGSSTPSRATLAGMGWTDEPPAARGQTRDRWESWQALMDQAAEFDRRRAATWTAFVDDLDRRAAEQHAPVADGVTLATFHAAKGLEWDSVFLLRAAGRHPADHLRRDAGRGRGGAPAALRRHDPGPARARRCPGRWPASPAAAGPASRPGSSTRCSPTRCSSRSRPRSSASKRGARMCRECGKPLSTGAEKKTRPLRRLPGVLRRGAVRAAARVAQGPGRRRGGAGVRGVQRRDAAADRRAQARPRPRRCSASPASARRSSRGTATTCSAVSLLVANWRNVIKSFAHDIARSRYLPRDRNNRVTSELTTPDAHTAPKEVDRMNSITTRRRRLESRSLTPSTFGMPACGHAVHRRASPSRDAVRVKGDMGLAVRTYVPGTSAWSPPPS